jgi:gliding motility-associated-like protein
MKAIFTQSFYFLKIVKTGIIPSLFLALFVLPSNLFSQTFSFNVVNSVPLVSNSNDSVVIFGNVVHEGTPSFYNDGHIYVSGDWENNSTGSVFTTGPDGWVHLDSAVQTIKGTSLTHFNNLELSGNSDSTKYLTSVDAEIEDTLVLNNHEFDAGDNTVFVLDSGVNSITRSTGFVSNTNDGGLSRNTASANTSYFFPVGSSVGTTRFRPVVITPNEADTSVYKVRMANVDPSSETFDRTVKDLPVGDINDNFYHRITRINGTKASDITVFYDSINDLVGPDYDILAYWADISGQAVQWDNPGKGVGVVYTYPDTIHTLKGLKKQGFNNFNPTTSTPIALSHNVDLKGDIFVANVFSPNGDGNNDFVFARARGLAEIQFVIYDRWGEKIFETTNLNVGWDGTYRGQLLGTGVFVYVVKGKFKSGDEVVQKGNITLLR